MIDMSKFKIPQRDQWKVYKTHMEPLKIFQSA